MMLFQEHARGRLVIPLADEMTFDVHVEAEALAKWFGKPPKGQG